MNLREKKGLRKESRYGYVNGLDRLRYEVRHHHIAYCLLRGRSMEEIESSPNEGNAPNASYIDEIKMLIEPQEVAYEKAVCSGA